MFRRKNDNSGSIVYNRARLNDDFALSANGINQHVNTDFTHQHITDLVDWSISFFINNTKAVTGATAFFDSRGGITSSSTDGIDIILIEFATYYTIRFRTGDGSGTRDYSFSGKNIPKNTLKYITINFDASTRDLILYVDAVKAQTINIGLNVIGNSSVTYSRFFYYYGSLASFPGVFFKGLCRDYATFERQLTSQEMTEFHRSEILPESTYDSCVFHMPFNNVAYDNGADKIIVDVVSNYDLSKVSPVTPKNGRAVSYSDDELGLNIGTSTFTAYGDVYTGVLGANFTGGGEFVNYKGIELRKYGLKFNGIDQYLSVPFTLAKDKGYTIEIAFTMPTNVAFASTQPILSKRDGATNYIEVLGDSTKKTLSLKYIDTGVEVGVGNVNTAQDISKMQYSVMRVSPIQNVYLKESIATYEKVYANNQIQCVQWNAVTGATEGINPFDEITVGFDDITGNLNIGYDGTNYFGGTLFAVRIWEGLLDVGENQINRNNGLLRNANDVTYSSKSNLKLDIDFNNPFDSGGLKLNDTSPNAAVLDAFGWANLAAIEAAKEEILSKF